MKNLFFVAVLILSFTGLLAANSTLPTGLWEFNNASDLTEATIGIDLGSVGLHSVVSGIDANDGAVLDGYSSYYSCTHQIAPSGGAYVNDWTLLLDIKVPASSLGNWVSLFQTNTSNSNDGDCFVHTNGTIGVADTGYSSNTIVADTWYRVIISVSNSNFYRIYVDGQLWLEGTPQAIDGRFSLDPQILLFADDSRDDAILHCSNAAIWPYAISSQHALSLGAASSAVETVSNAGLNLISNASAEFGISDWVVADGYDWQGTSIAGWHFPHMGYHYFTPGRAATAEIYQIVNIEFVSDEIDNGDVVVRTGGYIGGYDDDRGRIIVECRDGNDTILSSLDSGWIVGANTPNWTQLYLPDSNGFVVPSGTRSVKYRLLAEQLSGPDCQVFFDDLIFEYSLVAAGSNSPAIPSNTVPASGSTGVDVGVTLSTVSADTSNVSYQIDWGSEIGFWSDLQSLGSNYNTQYAWSTPGTYSVRTRCRDENDRISDWSLPSTITITGDAAGVFESQPYLQHVTQNSITIVWETDRLVRPAVEWGLTTSYGNQIYGQCINVSAGVYFCKVRLPNLDTQTTYHYRAYNGSTVSADAVFTTAPHEDTPFSFAVWGDSQQVARRLSSSPTHPECSTAMFTDMAAMTDIAVSVGDVVDWSSYYWYETAFRPYVSDILGKQKPFFIAFGNHDEPSTSLVHKAVENSGMRSCSFNYGNAHFVCIDYSDYVGGTLPLTWIEQDLASDFAQNATWRFLFIHIPVYCERWFAGDSMLQADLVPLLNQYNVQICFSGHTHEYQRGMLNGTFYVITGVCSYLDIAESIVKDWDFMTVGGAQDIPGLPEGGGLMHGWTEIQIEGTKLNLKMHGYNLDGSYYGVIDTVNYVQADFTMDGSVDMKDLAELVEIWLDSGQSSNKDIAERKNKVINMSDLAEMARYWQFQGEF